MTMEKSWIKYYMDRWQYSNTHKQSGDSGWKSPRKSKINFSRVMHCVSKLNVSTVENNACMLYIYREKQHFNYTYQQHNMK